MKDNNFIPYRIYHSSYLDSYTVTEISKDGEEHSQIFEAEELYGYLCDYGFTTQEAETFQEIVYCSNYSMTMAKLIRELKKQKVKNKVSAWRKRISYKRLKKILGIK